MADYSVRATLGAVDAGFTSAFRTATGAVSGLVGAVGSATKAIDSQLDAMKDSANSLNTAFSSITKKATTALGGAGLAGLTASVKGFGDFEQSIEAAEKLFGDSSGKVIENAKRSFTTANTSAHEYLDQVTRFSASLLQGLAGDTEKAADYADTALKDMSDNANMFGTELASIQNAYQGFARGEYVMLDNLRLGYGGTAGEMARLINDSGILKGVTLEAEDMVDVDLHTMIEAIHAVQKELEITGTTAYETDHTIAGSFAGMRAASMNLLIGMADDTANIGQLYDELLVRIEKFAINAMQAVGTVWDHMGHFHTLIYSLMGLGAIGGVIPILSKVNTAVWGLASNFGMFGTAIKLAMMPMLMGAGLIGGGLLVSGGAMYETFQAEFDRVGALIQTQGPGMILNLRNRIIDGIPRLAKSGTQLMTAITDSLVAVIPALFDLGRNATRSLVQGIIDNKDEISRNLLNLMNAVIPELITLAPFIMDMGVKLINAFIEGFSNNRELARTTGDNIKKSLIEAFNSLKSSSQDLYNTLAPIFRDLFNRLGEALPGWKDRIWEWLKPELIALFEKARELFNDGMDYMVGVGEEIWEWLEPELQNILNKIQEFFRENKGQIIAIGAELGSGLLSGLALAFSGKALMKYIGTKATQAVAGAVGGPALTGMAVLGIGYLYDKFRDAIIDFAQGFADKMLSIDFEETMENIKEGVSNFLQTAIGGLGLILADIITMLASADFWKLVIRAFAAGLELIEGIIGGIVSGVVDFVDNIGTAIGNAFKGISNSIFGTDYEMGIIGDRYPDGYFTTDLDPYLKDPMMGTEESDAEIEMRAKAQLYMADNPHLFNNELGEMIKVEMNINNTDYDTFVEQNREAANLIEIGQRRYPN